MLIKSSVCCASLQQADYRLNSVFSFFGVPEIWQFVHLFLFCFTVPHIVVVICLEHCSKRCPSSASSVSWYASFSWSSGFIYFPAFQSRHIEISWQPGQSAAFHRRHFILNYSVCDTLNDTGNMILSPTFYFNWMHVHSWRLILPIQFSHKLTALSLQSQWCHLCLLYANMKHLPWSVLCV